MRVVTTFMTAAALLLAASVPVALAQCGAHLLAALDENHQTFDASVWTNSPHCPASGQMTINTMPPGQALFDGNPYWVESFFDVFTECQTIKPQVIPTGPVESFFDIWTEVTFDDPVYPPLSFVEHVRITPLNRLEIVHMPPCGDAVPLGMYPEESYCFHVCHRVYTIPLMVPPAMGQPIISVSSGCQGPPIGSCMTDPCTPGDMNSFRYEVYQLGGMWHLGFEYSNPMMEPACYCVRYEGNLPLNGETHVLGGWENGRQTMDVSVWTNHPDFHVSGTIEVFSYPAGAQFEGGGGGGGGYRIDSFFDVFLKPWVFDPPVGAGSFTVGQQFQLIGYIHYEPPGPIYPPEWVVEDVMVNANGGLELVNPGCTAPPAIPPVINPGIPECLIVCHDVYHIPINWSGPTAPTLTFYSGCGPVTPCNSVIPCNPGAWTDFRYEVFRVGGTWMLEFEYSNPGFQPACYCVEATGTPAPDPTGFLLCGLAPDGQHMNISVWGNRPDVPLSGTIHLSSDPPDPPPGGFPAESFFDLYTVPYTWKPAVGPGIFLPGEVFQIVATVEYFGPGSDPFEGQVCAENVIVTPMNTLALWDPSTPCTGDFVPTSMIPGQTECFRVCHRIYETTLFYNPGGGRPVIHVTPGCRGLPYDSCTAEACVPGGPNDYVATVYHDGVDWKLRFEYSNPYIEPVCYCVSYAGNVPWDCDTRELTALDEGHQHLDVSLRTFSYGGHDCPAGGRIQVFSDPAGANIGPYSPVFSGVGADWFTLPVPVGPGAFLPGETFRFITYYDYTDPEYPDRWLTEEVIVAPNGQHLWIRDIGGECATGGGDNVPPLMALGQSECFRVCHRVYHVSLAVFDPLNPPTVTITPGCFGPPQDQCSPDPTCTPGGQDDYRWVVWWAGSSWELEFEHSNPGIEPVCYCVTVVAPPPVCSTHELVALDEGNQLLKVSIVSLDPSGTGPCEVSGTVTLSSDPPGMYFERTTWTFTGVGDTWHSWAVPIAPGPDFPAESFFDIIVEIDYDDPDQPDVIETEMVQMNLTGGGLVKHDAGGECAAGGGSNVPDVLHFGQPECLTVCHDVYYIPLELMATVMPTVTVYPGCGPSTPCNDPLPCVPGGAHDYRYKVFRVGGTWMLEFEYSNENIEPVCYCVEISSAPPVPYEAYLLAALDEVHQNFDVTLWTSAGAPVGNGTMIATIGPGADTTVAFAGVGPDYQTWHFPVDSGALTDSETFQLAAIVQFNDPVFGRLHYEETVIITAAGTLLRWDPITPCAGDLVPAMMNDNTAQCFVVCHKVYDILLNAPPSPLPPVITVAQGCFGGPHDHCPPPVVCQQGGLMDYCYRFWFDGVYWHLIFEYSNPYIEPVCYCVTIGVVPCLPVTDLVIQWPDTVTNKIRLGWTCPQWGQYIIYYTTVKNNDGNPPGPGWYEEGRLIGNVGQVLTWQPPTAPSDTYRNYVIKVNCEQTR